MATYVARAGKWRAVVRKKGQTATKTFSKKALAKAWAVDTEAAIERRQIFAKGHTLGSILDRYRAEIVDTKPYNMRAYRSGPRKGTQRPSPNSHHLKRLARLWRAVDLSKCTQDWWVSEMTGSFTCKPQSRGRYMSLTSSALRTAEELWEISVDWLSFRRGKALLLSRGIVSKGKRRKRLPTEDEIARIKARSLTMNTELPMSDIIDVAGETGLREAELCRIRWADLDEKRKMLLVRDRKHPKEKMGNNFNVPLLGKSFDIIMRQPRTSEFIFPYNPETVGHRWRTARDLEGILDLKFHDNRHKAITTLFKRGYAIQEVALVSGHTNWESLRIYTEIDPESLHDGPLGRRSEHTN